jgi:glutamate-1-semialdehyde 2,1-aminomutase
MDKYVTEKSRQLHIETKKYLVDGVGSFFHKNSFREYPIAMTHGKGSKLYDVDGNEYIDYVLGFGPMLLGHSPQAVNEAVRRQLTLGSHFSAPNEALLRLSKKLTEIIPSAEAESFQNSGTEVVMHAMRLARAYTGKYTIIKFEGQYHGWSDEEKISIDAERIEDLGDREKPNKIIHTKGQRLSSADDLIVLPWNDLEIVERTLKENVGEIAAILTEPIMCDSGPILPNEGYLKGLRRLADKYGAVLIFDEVITGFRTALGGAQEYYGVNPDLSTFAKAMIGGYPFGAVVGKKEIMECGIHASGTFNGNPIGTVAALATIEELSKPGIYEQFDSLAKELECGFRALAEKYNIKIYTRHIGSIFILYFGFEEDPEDFRDWLGKADIALYEKFIERCEDYGIRYTDRRGREYLSTAHTREDIRHTLEVADQVLSEIVLR